MGNAIDKVLNKGPPFAPKCVPECTPGPNDLRGNICYKGNCVALCPIDSTIAETGRVKVVRMDADPLVTAKIIDSFMEKGVKIKLAERNYHERSAEISIQHVERVLSRILLSLPFYAPVWLATAFWIAICEMLNFLITYPNQQSPSDKYRGNKTDVCSFSWLPIGQLVLIRAEDRSRKNRDPSARGEDAIVGQSFARLAILLGWKYDRHQYMRECIPITDNKFDKKQFTMRNYCSNPRALPHVLELFPKSLQLLAKPYPNIAELHIHQQLSTMNTINSDILQVEQYGTNYSTWAVCSDDDIKIIPQDDDYELNDINKEDDSQHLVQENSVVFTLNLEEPEIDNNPILGESDRVPGRVNHLVPVYEKRQK